MSTLVEINDGRTLLTAHHPTDCYGEFCSVHNPSPHHMRDWPQHWRGDRNIMERICPHGIGHPDPDDIAHHMRLCPEDSFYGVHGCDGCCLIPPAAR